MTATREQRILPDGCMDLIWMDGAVHVAGPDTRAFLATVGPRQVVTGLRFRPGAAPGVLGVPEPDLALNVVLAQLRAGSSVTATADALGWTDRTLHRRCRDAFGYGPSVLSQLVRVR